MSLTDAAVLLAVMGLGLPAAWVATRALPLALLLAPLVSALLATGAVLLMVALGGTFVPWLAVVAVAQVVALLWLPRRAGRPAPHGRWTDVLWAALPMAPPFLLIVNKPYAWDAHSIWWLHAAYFTKGSTVTRAAIGNPVFQFSHTDYPPLPSAAVAAVWSVTEGYSYRLAQCASSLLTFSAIALLSYAVRRVTDRAPVLVSRLAGVAVGTAAWSTAPSTVTNGMTDPLWSACFVAGAVVLLIGREPGRHRAVPLLLLGVAALSKNEGLVAVVVLAVLVTVRDRRAWQVWLPVGATGLWVVLARSAGARSDIQADGRFGALLAGDRAVLDRFAATIDALWTFTAPTVLPAVLAAALGLIFLRASRRTAGLGSDLWLWAGAPGSVRIRATVGIRVASSTAASTARSATAIHAVAASPSCRYPPAPASARLPASQPAQTAAAVTTTVAVIRPPSRAASAPRASVTIVAAGRPTTPTSTTVQTWPGRSVMASPLGIQPARPTWTSRH